MGKILVGTSSWTDKTLIESRRFYPPEADTPEERLRYYAQQFKLVEVDSSYYFPPNERNSSLWVARTPDDFTFNIKSYSLFTQHPTKPSSLWKDVREALSLELQTKNNLYYKDIPGELMDLCWQRFRSALLPLHSAGKLGCVLLQFPEWFHIGRRSKEHIIVCRDRLPEYRLAVEFRHASWMREENQDETVEFLADNNLVYVCVDEPQGFPSSVPPVVAATCSELAVVRFHGRNVETWAKRGIGPAERFRYKYSEHELREWVPRIRELAAAAAEVHVLMNNCYQDYAVANAKQLADMIESEE